MFVVPLPKSWGITWIIEITDTRSYLVIDILYFHINQISTDVIRKCFMKITIWVGAEFARLEEEEALFFQCLSSSSFSSRGYWSRWLNNPNTYSCRGNFLSQSWNVLFVADWLPTIYVVIWVLRLFATRLFATKPNFNPYPKSNPNPNLIVAKSLVTGNMLLSNF